MYARARVCVYIHTHVLCNVCPTHVFYGMHIEVRGQLLRAFFSPATRWSPGIKLGSSDSLVSVFICSTILPVPGIGYFNGLTEGFCPTSFDGLLKVYTACRQRDSYSMYQDHYPVFVSLIVLFVTPTTLVLRKTGYFERC